MLVADPKAAGSRKVILKEEHYNATNFMTLWEFEGVLKYSPLFYGWYTNSDPNAGGYRLPFAYFVTGLMVYAYSFFATLRKMAENSRMSKLSEKDDEYIFSWKLFTAWDYMIGNAETAHNRVASIVMGFKEALLEEAEKKKDTRNWKVICCRVLVNTVVIGLLSFSVFAVVMVVKRSTEQEANDNFWRKNETTIVISLITLIFPMIFEVLGFFEQYHPRRQLRLQLARIMVLNLLNLYSLIFALIDKISDMTQELGDFKNLTERIMHERVLYNSSSTNIAAVSSVAGNYIGRHLLMSESLISELAWNITDLTYPKLVYIASNFVTENVPDNITMDFFNSTMFPDNTTIATFTENSLSDFLNTSISTIDYEEVKNIFEDYLTYILHSFKYDNDSSEFNSTADYYNQTENITIYGENETTFTTVPTIYAYNTSYYEFKNTLLPLLMNNTDFFHDDRFENDLTTVFNDVMTAISTFSTTEYDTSTTECLEDCEGALNSNSTNMTLDVVTTPFSGIEISLNYSMKSRLRSLCWETMFGQELIKLTVMDLIMTIFPTLAIDFFRGIFVRVMNRCWCWDLEKKFPQYGDFKVAENILSLVNNQGMVWMGMFFSPGLVVFNVIKLYIMMYFRTWAVLTCNAPPEVIFRASRSNNFYYALLLMMLFLCVLPVGYAIVWIQPSWHCGPFSQYHRIFHIFTKSIKNNVPPPVQHALDYIASPGIVIPLLVLLILIIYYLVSLTGALRGANEELKIQLKRERTEERRKMFQLVDRRRRGGSGESNELSNTPFNKWKKLIGNLPSGKSLDDTPKQETEEIPSLRKEEKPENKSKDFFSKLIKKALGKSSSSEDEPNADDGTDNEQHDSLPDDPLPRRKSSRPSFSWGKNEFQNAANIALQMKKKPIENLSEDGEVDKRPWKRNKQLLEKNEQSKLQDQISHVPKNIEESPDVKHVLIKDQHTKLPLRRRDSIFDSKEASTSKALRQDSETSSNWSDNIPMITISKTESSEDILDRNIKHTLKSESQEFPSTFKPKIKCVLKKQTAEIDEDTICYFGEDLEKNINDNKLIAAIVEDSNRHLDDSNDSPLKSACLGNDLEDCRNEEILSDRSSSEETECKDNSVDTVLNVSISGKEN